MKKPMTDFVNRGGLGELLAAATQAIEAMRTYSKSKSTYGLARAVDRLQLAVNDGIKAREDEAKAAVDRVTAQRDEARAEVKRLRGLVYAGHHEGRCLGDDVCSCGHTSAVESLTESPPQK